MRIPSLCKTLRFNQNKTDDLAKKNYVKFDWGYFVHLHSRIFKHQGALFKCNIIYNYHKFALLPCVYSLHTRIGNKTQSNNIIEKYQVCAIFCKHIQCNRTIYVRGDELIRIPIVTWVSNHKVTAQRPRSSLNSTHIMDRKFVFIFPINGFC